MKYTSEFSEQIRELDFMVILQKEYDLYEHKKCIARKMIAIHYHRDRSKQRLYEKEFRDMVRQMKILERQMSPKQEFINCPKSIISRYMELYQVSIPSVARTLQISAYSITQYLQKGIQSHEIKSFICWAVRNFRLDANRYLNLIESLSNKEVV